MWCAYSHMIKQQIRKLIFTFFCFCYFMPLSHINRNLKKKRKKKERMHFPYLDPRVNHIHFINKHKYKHT